MSCCRTRRRRSIREASVKSTTTSVSSTKTWIHSLSIGKSRIRRPHEPIASPNAVKNIGAVSGLRRARPDTSPKREDPRCDDEKGASFHVARLPRCYRARSCREPANASAIKSVICLA